ncbi:MAG: NAD(P)-dependent oxidoreductase [Acutalibacteraceae bacterium]
MAEKKRAIILTSQEHDANRVYDSSVLSGLKDRYDLFETVIYKKNIGSYLEQAQNAQYIFSTWGMEHFSAEEIKTYFPKAECLFYAAGSVQHFAKEFLDCNIRVFSAWQANAVPVAEYTYAQILLALKGFYRAAKRSRFSYYPSAKYAGNCGGVYNAKIGIIGVGCIGRAVAEKLKANDVEVYYYDPYLPEEAAEKLNIQPASLEEIFKNCDVITNHLANKEELTGVLSGRLFDSMKPYAVFINTGRGRQVDEKGLVKAMKKVKTRTALLDVLVHEPLKPFSQIARCKNIIVTPHIAGSLGREVVRMAKYMADDAQRLDNGEAPLYEVTSEMLRTMA